MRDPIYIDETYTFAAIARQNQARMTELRELFDRAMKARKARKGPDIPSDKRIGEIIKEKNACARIAIIFAAVAAESFIYSFAVKTWSRSYVERHLERLDLVSKWVLIPPLAIGIELPRDGRAYQLLKQLVTNRNALVHAKPKSFDLAKTTFAELEDYFSRHVEQADHAIQALDALIPFASQFVRPEFAQAHLGGIEEDEP